MTNAAIIVKGSDEHKSVTNIVKQSKYIKTWWQHDTQSAPENLDITIRWGCTANAPTKKVINTAKAIHKVYNKGAMRRELFLNGLTVPTITSSDCRVADLVFPLVVRPLHHERGKNLFLAGSWKDFVDAATKCGEGWYASSFFDKKREFRVFVVQGRVIQVVEKHPKDKSGVSWGCAEQGIFENVKWSQWPTLVCLKAIGAHNLSGLDFSAIDVMTNHDCSEAHVLELNTAPQMDGMYSTGCLAKALDWILEKKTKETLSLGPNDWKGLIHPAISNLAEG